MHREPRGLAPAAAPGPGAAPEREHDGAPVVLVVDDHAENLVAFDAALAPLAESLGVQVVLADSADSALRAALEVGDRLAVVLLDMMMPGTDGLETARLLRGRRQSAHVPVLFVTALDAERERLAEAYATGAVDYLTKPVDPDLLRSKVAAFVEIARRNAEHRRSDRRAADVARADSAAARARLVAVLDVLPDAVITCDATWRVVYANSAGVWWLRSTASHGPDGEATIGRVLWDVAPDLLGTAFERAARGGAAARRVATFEERRPALDRWFEYRMVPGPDATLTLFARDVTERVTAAADRERLLAEAEAARAAAEEANASKSGFLAMMSHELRTPLNAIAGHVQLVAMGIHGPVTDAQRESLDRVQRAQHHLLSLINDVLNYAKLESGRVEYAMRRTRVADVVGGVTALVGPQFVEKRIALDVAALDDEAARDVEVWADPDKLGQVLLNLLSNALKFTASGGRVRVRLEPPVDGGAVAVHVDDTGAGIAEDRLATIFEPFVQVHRNLATPQEGTGLGLAISRDLARGMGGDLTVHSEPGRGSTFTITLRRAAAGEDRAP